jgi:pimeloyl-ACP methyl ester carboxylesterase
MTTSSPSLNRPQHQRRPATVARRCSLRALGAFSALSLLTACAQDVPTAPAATSALVASRMNSTEEPGTGPWSRIVRGETGPGSLYALYVPQQWNGDLVTIAHGFRDAAVPVTNTPESYMGALRDALGASGYAVAYSSYSENGFAVKDGAQRTHQLRGLAAAQLGGQPQRSYLVGFSLGGAVALSLAEQYPSQYDGALLACGMVGGSLPQTQYLGDVRVLFDVAFPDLLQGNVLGVPNGYMVNAIAVQGAVVQDLQTKLALQQVPSLFAIASTRQTPLPWVPANAVPTMIESLITALTFHARGINNITDLVNDKVPFGNSGVTYALGTPAVLPGAFLAPTIAQLDLAAGRYTMSPAARQYLAQHYTPTGSLATKVLTLHNQWDPVVPAFHQDSLGAAVSRAGNDANLVQRRRAQYGHCTFDGATLMTAFSDLATWSRTGVKP